MKTRKYLFFGMLLIGSILVGLMLAVLLDNWRSLEIDAIPVEVTVTNTSLIGFNVGTDKLYFGTVVDGGHSNRDAHTTTEHDAIVTIRTVGEVAGWVHVSMNEFFLAGGETQDLQFRLKPPQGTPSGNYTGTVVIEYMRPWPWQ